MAQTEEQRKRNAVGLCDPNSEFFDGPCKDNRAEMMDACKVTKGENDKFIDRREDRNRRIEKRNRDPKTRNKRKKSGSGTRPGRTITANRRCFKSTATRCSRPWTTYRTVQNSFRNTSRKC